MKTGENIRQRKDGRFEARYEKGRDPSGKIIYGSCYGNTYEEAKEKRDYMLGKQNGNREMNLLILGAGSHGAETYDVAYGLHIFQKISYLDDDESKKNVIGPWSAYDHYLNEYPLAIVAVGDSDLRKRWTLRLNAHGFLIPTLVHPTAVVAVNAEIGMGSVICARATLSTGSRVGKGCIISSGATIGREAVLPDWAFVDDGETIHRARE